MYYQIFWLDFVTENSIFLNYNEQFFNFVVLDMYKTDSIITNNIPHLHPDIVDIIEDFQKLEESHERYKILSDIADEGILIHSDFRIIDCNKALTKIFGYERAEVIGKPLDMLINAEDKHFVKSNISEGYEDYYEFRGTHKDGSDVFIYAMGKNYNYKGIQSRLSVFNNVTKLRKTLDKLDESELMFRNIAEQSLLGIAILKEEKFTFMNQQFTNICGLDENSGISDFFAKIYSDDKNLVSGLFTNQDRSVKIENYEIRYNNSNNEIIWLKLFINRIKVEKQDALLITLLEITSNKNAETQLIKTQKEAIEANKVKSAILSNIAHELRTPLNGILGFASLLKESSSDSEQREMVEYILLSGYRLNKTLNSLIKLTELESKKSDAVKFHVEINSIFFEKETDFRRKAIDKGLKFICKYPEEDVIIQTNPQLLGDILDEIYDNAIKFTDSGKVELSAENKEYNGIPYLVIKIRDTGRGIPKEDVSKIFRPFRQSSEGFSRDHEGIGLGLALVQRMARLIDAKIVCRPAVPNGTTFKIKIPLVQVQQEE